MRLSEALSGLDAKAFERLCRRRGVSLDERQRLSPIEQAARQLADWARVADLSDLPEPARRVTHHLMTHPEGGERAQLGGGVMPLLDRDLAFEVPGHPDRIAMPAAYRVRLSPVPGEDRTSVRALLAVSPEDTWAALGAQLLGRQAVGPASLWLGQLLERLESPEGLAGCLAELSPKQRRLLEAAEARGGQLEADELLALEQSPARVQLAGGALPTRSASYQLFVRGLLLPRTRGVWVVPTEVGAKVGSSRRAIERERRRELLKKVAEDEDLSPARAELSDDPGPAAVALLATLDAHRALPMGGRAVKRSALEKAAAEVGVEAERAELLVALARGAGARLDASALADVGALLFRAWRDGGAWDESRREPDAHRTADAIASLATPTRGLRDALLELLEAMPSERFAPVDELCRAGVRDLRNAGAARLLARCQPRERFLEEPVEVMHAMLDRALVALGALDRARVDGRDVVRLSARARRWISGERHASLAPSRWEGGRLRIGSGARVGPILEAAEAAHALVVGGGLTLRYDPDSCGRALARKKSSDAARSAAAALAAPIDPLAERAFRAAAGAHTSIHRVAVSGYLPIPDPVLRARISEDPELREMIVARSPAEGLLIRQGVSSAKLERALARLGVTVDGDDAAV